MKMNDTSSLADGCGDTTKVMIQEWESRSRLQVVQLEGSLDALMRLTTLSKLRAGPRWSHMWRPVTRRVDWSKLVGAS